MTFRQKTIVGVASIEAILLLILVWTGINYLRTSNETELIKRASATLTLLSRASRDAGTLHRHCHAARHRQRRRRGHRSWTTYASRNPDGIILSGGQANNSRQADALTPTIAMPLSMMTRFDSAIDIKESKTVYGRIEIGLVNHTHQNHCQRRTPQGRTNSPDRG